MKDSLALESPPHPATRDSPTTPPHQNRYPATQLDTRPSPHQIPCKIEVSGGSLRRKAYKYNFRSCLLSSSLRAVDLVETVVGNTPRQIVNSSAQVSLAVYR
jgi:hypothetical protein